MKMPTVTTRPATYDHATAAPRRTGCASKNDKAPPETAAHATIKTKRLCLLVRQLACLLQAGMPVVPALSALLEQYSSDPEVRRHGREDPLVAVLRDIRDRVNAGANLSEALAAYPEIFSPLFTNMVAAGEAGGTLEQVLLRIAATLEKRLELTGKVKAAIAYPVMMAVVAVAVVAFLLSYVVPGITRMFMEMNRTLPWPTMLLIAVSNFTKSYFLLILLAICAAALGIGAASRGKRGKLLADRIKLRLPLFGGLLLKLETARLTRILAVLLSSGIPILNALEIVKRASTNSVIAKALDRVKDSVSRGDALADAIRNTAVFPPFVFHVTATGAANDSLEQALANLADMYDAEVENTSRILASLLEPAVLLVMGIIIGFIVLAILLPIFEINQAL